MPWEEAEGTAGLADGADPSLPAEAQLAGSMAQHLAPRFCPGSWQAWAQAKRSLTRAGLGGCPVAAVCPLSSLPPHSRSQVWKLEETGPSSPLPDVQLSQSTTTGPRDRHLLGLRAGTVLDSCTNLCTPLSICYIECIYVGNMLASVCRCCASCAPQHRALTWPWPGWGPE